MKSAEKKTIGKLISGGGILFLFFSLTVIAVGMLAFNIDIIEMLISKFPVISLIVGIIYLISGVIISLSIIGIEVTDLIPDYYADKMFFLQSQISFLFYFVTAVSMIYVGMRIVFGIDILGFLPNILQSIVHIFYAIIAVIYLLSIIGLEWIGSRILLKKW